MSCLCYDCVGDIMITFKWNDFDFTLIEFGKGVFKKDMAGHSHSKNSYEMHFIVDGEGALITDTEEYKLSKGNFFVTGPNIYHKQSTNPQKPLTEYYLYIQTSDKKTNNALVSTFLSNHFYFYRNCEMLSLVERIIQESNVKKWGYENIIAALMQILLTEITRLYWPDFRVTNKSAENLNDRRFILIEQAFINDPEGITLTKLSGTIGLCERQTQRLLEKYYGMSFLQKKAESIKR